MTEDEPIRPTLPKGYLVVFACVVFGAGVFILVMLLGHRGRTDHGVASVEILADRAFTALVSGDEDTLVELMDPESIDLYSLDCPHGREKIEPINAQHRKDVRAAIARVHAHSMDSVRVSLPSLQIAMKAGQKSFFDCVFKATLIGYEYDVELEIDGVRKHGFLNAWQAGDKWYLRTAPEVY